MGRMRGEESVESIHVLVSSTDMFIFNYSFLNCFSEPLPIDEFL